MPVNLVKKIGGAINITYGQYNGYVYFFHEDGTYSRFNRLTCELEYYNDINKGWNGWPAQWVYPHTAISWDNQYVYFFRGPEFICYNMVRDCVEGSIASVQQRWPGWPVDWLDRVDAALYWGYHLTNKTKQNNRYIYEIHKKAYFFRNDEYIRYDIENNRVDENYPLKIKEYWHGWPDHWTQVWAAVDWGNGKVYFFSETEYLCYDKFFDRVDDGYPRPLYEFFTEHQDKLNQESHTLIFEDQIPQASRSNFTNAVRSIATQLNIRPNWLMASIWTESGFNPLAKNGQYYGLHQMSLLLIYTYWGKTALKAKFPTLFHGQAFNELTNEAKSKLASEFSNLGFDQIHVIGRWMNGSLRGQKVKCRSYDQLRLIGFGGYGFGKEDGQLLANVVPKSNPLYDLNNDKKIDLAEFREAVFNLFSAYKFPNNPALDSELRHNIG